MEQQEFDWEVPQRQPAAGLVIVLIKTVWEIVKRLWPFLLLYLFNEKPGKESRYELIAILFGALALFNSITRFYFFRFCIINDELVIRKGWLKKETLIVPLTKIQAVHIEESAVHKLLGIVRMAVDTAGSTKTEVTIDALRRPMAEALQARLNALHEERASEHNVASDAQTIVTLNIKDLLRLSLSANHVEALAILLSFAYGIYDSLKTIGEEFLTTATGFFPRSSGIILAFLAVVVLFVIVVISTIRIFLKFYNFTVTRTGAGFYIKSGLANVKEQLVAFPKVQFISWRANWVRKQLGLWLLEYKIAGGEEVKKKMRVEVPVTRYSQIAPLSADYGATPDIQNMQAIRIHRSYVARRIVLLGFLPALVLAAIIWYWWRENTALFLCFPLLVGLKSFLLQRRFRAYAREDLLLVNRSAYGTRIIVLQWQKLQTATISQSLQQRRNELATLHLHTAAGTITLPHIPLEAAQNVLDHSLYKVETSAAAWM